MANRLLSLLVGGLLLVVPAGAQAATVTVHVEGKSAALVSPTRVLLPTAAFKPDGTHDCAATSAGGALQVGAGGDWAASYGSFGYFLTTIKGVNPGATDFNDYWALWVNDKFSSLGVCDPGLQEGDKVLFLVDRCEFDSTLGRCTNDPVLPLDARAPATVQPGAPFDVKVVEHAQDAPGTASPVNGAMVTGGGASATTNAAGVASVTLSNPGAATLRATKSGRAGDEVKVCATTGSDGYCATKTPEGVVVEPAPTAAAGPCASNGHDGLCGSSDHTAAVGRIVGIADRQRFGRGKGPRTLAGSVADDPSGIKDVRIRLTRNDGGRCSAYAGKTERFTPTRTCRAKNARFFSVGDRQQWSYLLPSALPRGRYVLDVLAVDKAGNVDHLQRNRTRVVFRVA